MTVLGQITGGFRSSDGATWTFYDQAANPLTSVSYAEFSEKYQDLSAVDSINGVKVWKPSSMSTAVVPAATLNAVARSADERQLTLAADGEVIPVTYGRDRTGGKLLNVLSWGGNVVIQVLWGMALDAVEKVYLNDVELTSGVTSYVGSQGTVDATMQAAYAAQSPAVTYTDTLAGLAYSVIVTPAASFSGGINVTGLLRGRKVYDQRKDSTNGGSGSHRANDPATWEFSESPTLHLQDFLRDTVYGAGETVDYASFALAATWNATDLGGGEIHRKAGFTLKDAQPVPAVREALRTMAGLFLARRGSTWYAVRDKATAAVASYSHAAGQIAGWSDLEKKDLAQQPTVVEIVWTDTSQVPWRDRVARTPIPAGAYRLSTVRMPWIQSYSQAYREAVERLNKLQADLSFSLRVFDIGIAHEAGDRVDVTLPLGLTDKPMWVTDVAYVGPGLWELALTEYDPAAWSLDIVTESTIPDTTLPNPAAPPAVTAVDATEDYYRGDNGLWFSRARVDITAPTYLWFAAYEIEVWDGATLVHSGTTVQTTWRSPSLKDGPTYTCKVRIVSLTGSSGAWVQDTFPCVGKLAPPSDVPSITGFEVGGDVYLGWQPAVDVDIWRYELRYGTTGGSWESATLLDRVDALRYISKGVIPAGSWKLWVKALDSVGNYSANAASVTLTVTVDPDALQTEKWFTSPTLTNMSAYQLVRGGPTYYVTDPNAAGDKFGAQFSASLGTYGNALATYHTSATSTWQGEAYDFGVSIAGDWQCEAVATALSGSYTLTLQLSDNGSSWTDYTTFPVKRAARYVKVKIEALTTSTIRVLAGSVRAWVNAVTKKESGVKTVTASGVYTVDLTGKYFTYKSIVVTSIDNGANAYFAVADNVTLSTTGANSFDVYLFDTAGNRVAGDISWKFEGV